MKERRNNRASAVAKWSDNELTFFDAALPNVMRSALGRAFLLASCVAATCQQPTAPDRAKVSLSLPAATDYESAKIVYFIEGGDNPYRRLQVVKGQLDYDLDVYDAGKPADSIRLIAAVPGCEILALEIDLKKNPAPWYQLGCAHLEGILFHGQFDTSRLDQNQQVKVVVEYVIPSTPLFQLPADLHIFEARVGTTATDKDGRFSIVLPLYTQTSGEFRFYLVDAKTEELISELRKEPKMPDDRASRITPQRDYPALVKFIVRRAWLDQDID